MWSLKAIESAADFEKNRVEIFWRIFSSKYFPNNNYYIINHNMAFFNLIFVIKSKNKDANKQ